MTTKPQTLGTSKTNPNATTDSTLKASTISHTIDTSQTFDTAQTFAIVQTLDSPQIFDTSQNNFQNFLTKLNRHTIHPNHQKVLKNTKTLLSTNPTINNNNDDHRSGYNWRVILPPFNGTTLELTKIRLAGQTAILSGGRGCPSLFLMTQTLTFYIYVDPNQKD